MKLSYSLITEAKLSDKITSRTNVTFDALINAVLNHKDKKITDENIGDFEKDLDTKTASLKKYVEAAKSAKFLNLDGSVVEKYIPDESGGSVKAGGSLDKALSSKELMFKAPNVNNNNVFNKQIFTLLSLMDGQAASSGVKNSIMLTGDPGTGKTSFIRGFSKLLGLPLITIEAPHITEEHIINIPFMIMVGDKISSDSAVVTTSQDSSGLNDLTSQKFEIVQSESNLVTKLKSMKSLKLTTEELITNLKKDRTIRDGYTNNKALITNVRESYNCILFLDEYFRNDNMKIRNILRNILNGQIGNDKIPPGVFIVYASNLSDDGVEDIPMNNDFVEMEFKSPDKEQWFDYFLKKYEKNISKEFPSIKLNPQVFNTFYDNLTAEDLSYDDKSVEVRSSPRRWEQLLLYINANLPVANFREASILMTNVELNFKNYTNGAVSDLYPKIKKIMVDLIKQTSKIDFDGSTHPQTEWRDVLEQQLLTKIKMDGDSESTAKEARKYVPIISGEPGIGKCLRGNQEIIVEIDEVLYKTILEIRAEKLK
jgi:hypothetical protein